MLGQLYQDAPRCRRVHEPDVSPHQPGPGHLVNEAHAHFIQRLQLVGDSLHLEADVVKALAPACDVGCYQAVRTGALQQLKVGLPDRDEAAANADVLPHDDLAGLEAEQATVKLDALVEAGYGDSDVMHQVGGNRWRSGYRHF